MNFTLNIRKSPEDSRDHIFVSNFLVPGTLDYRDELNPVRNQGEQGSCYAQSAACMKEWQEKRDYGLNEYLSPQFLYNNRFNYNDDITTNDYGMFGRDVMKLLKNVGICLEKNYEYGKIEKKEDILPKYFEEAKRNKIKAYAQVKTIENLKKSLYQNGPCLITFPVYRYDMKMWKQLHVTEIQRGGHAMTIVGYTSHAFIIRNSWGKNWGDGGYCYYPFNEWESHWEVWTTIDKKDSEETKDEVVDEVVDDNINCPCVLS